MTVTRVLIVDDAAEVRRDLGTLLKLDPGIQIVGEAADGLEATRRGCALQPEVILMDLEMPVMDGFEATRLIRDLCPGCRVIALTVHDSEDARQRAVLAGVDAFIVKGAPVEVLLNAILDKRE